MCTYLDRGGNLFDTSSNYADGLSEELVGDVLRGRERDSVIVVTKGGYIQGQNMELARRRGFPETVYYGEGIWHCIHPDFLRTQIGLSLERMRTSKIDGYLLHNPEYYLSEKEHHGGVSPSDHEEFYRRIRRAFLFLEEQVERGSIDWYGISSNNFGLPAAHPAVTSVERCLEEARALEHNHHFRLVQLPLNLFEAGGALEKNNDGRTVLEFCRDEGIGVLVNRPLNAFAGHRMTRLADFLPPDRQPPGEEALRELLEPLRRHEQRLVSDLQVPLFGGPPGLAGTLESLVPQMQSTAHWEQAAGHYVVRPLQSWLRETQDLMSGNAEWHLWAEDLIRIVNSLFDDITKFCAAREQVFSDSVRARLHAAGYPEGKESLSRMAMHVLANLPGLSCVLNGMRRKEYVEDALGVIDLPPIDGLKILRNFAR